MDGNLFLNIHIKNALKQKSSEYEQRIDNIFKDLLNSVDYILKFNYEEKTLFICAADDNSVKIINNIINQNKIDVLTSTMPIHKLAAFKNKAFDNTNINANQWGCYNCLSIFSINDLDDQINKNYSMFQEIPNSFYCPYCGEQCLIPEENDIKLNKEFLYEIEKFVFGRKIENINEFKMNEKITFTNLSEICFS